MRQIEVSTPEALTNVLAEQRDGQKVVPLLSGTAWATWSSHAVLRESSHAVLWGSSHAVLWESSHAVLWESSHAVLWGSSHAVLRESSHAVLWESSHAVLWESSHAVLRESSHAVLWESSHAVLRESSDAELWGAAVARAWGRNRVTTHSPHTVVLVHSSDVTVEGPGMVITVPPIESMAAWCAYYGVPVTDGVAVLYKAVRDDYHSRHGFAYRPGTAPEAPDWDGGNNECGGGLHFVAHPMRGRDFDSEAMRYVACPVALADCRPPRVDDRYPAKVKARRLCGPVVEVDARGEPLMRKGRAS